MGSITKELNKRTGKQVYRVRVDVVKIDPKTGRERRSQPQTTCATRKEAEAVLRKWETEVEQGTNVDRSRQTVKEMMDYWLETYARPKLLATTVEDYEATIRVHILPFLGAVPVQKLTAAQLQKFYGDRKAAGVGNRTMEMAHLRLKQALTQAVKLGVVNRNVAELVEPPRVERTEMKTWTVDQARAFLDVAHESTYGPIWVVLMAAGMRRGEALGLRWCDVNWEDGQLRIAQSVTLYQSKPHIQQPKTAAARRHVALDALTMASLREHRIRQNERRLAAGSAWHDHDLIFAADNGNPINPNNLIRDFLHLVERAGNPRIRVHDLRHTHVTLALQAGTQITTVSKRVGHARPSVTMNLYAHVTPDMQQEAAETMADVLYGGRRG